MAVGARVGAAVLEHGFRPHLRRQHPGAVAQPGAAAGGYLVRQWAADLRAWPLSARRGALHRAAAESGLVGHRRRLAGVVAAAQ